MSPTLEVADVLDRGDQVADLARAQPAGRGHHRAEDPDLVDHELLLGRHHPDPLARADRAVEHPDVDDHPPVGVVLGVEDQGRERSLGVPPGRGHPGHHRLQDLVDPDPVARRGEDGAGAGKADHLLDLAADQLGVGRREVDLVDHRDQLVVVLQGQVDVGEGLGLDPLGGVDHQDRALAGGQGPGDLVGEVHVTGGVDEVELVGAAVPGRVLHPDRLGLDGDAPLPLQVQGVEHLSLHVPRSDRAGPLQQAVGQGGLAVVDVGDDREVADGVAADRGHAGHRIRSGGRRLGPHRPPGAPRRAPSAGPAVTGAPLSSRPRGPGRRCS